MASRALTSNRPIPTFLPRQASFLPINCTNNVSSASPYVEAVIAEVTRRAYRTDLADFRRRGGRDTARRQQASRGYISAVAGNAAVATIPRRLAAISVAQETINARNPAASPLVRVKM